MSGTVDPDQAVQALRAAGDPAKAVEMAAYHKAPRVYLGVSNPAIDLLVADWRATTDVSARVALARGLWDSDIHEARVAAAKLLTQARLRPDEDVWKLICEWVPVFDAWAIADHAAKAGDRRLLADPSRLDHVEQWITHPNMWTRRAALVMTLPWTKQNHPTPQDQAIRDRVLGWAANLTGDRDWFIQKAIAWWVRDLSKHDPDRAAAFLAEHGPSLKSFARKEAAQYLPVRQIDDEPGKEGA
jgi:3-methyladenine DNA glycosylase AlkD